MPAYYQYHCDTCDYRAVRYRNVKRCKCGGNLIREKLRARPNRVVVEIGRAWEFSVRAERPDDVMVIFWDKVLGQTPGYEPRVFGDGGLPIEPLPVQRTAVGVVGPVEMRFEVAGEPEEEA